MQMCKDTQLLDRRPLTSCKFAYTYKKPFIGYIQPLSILL